MTEKTEEKTPKQEREDKLRELLSQELVQAWFGSGSNAFHDALTPAAAAKAAMKVFEPLLNALDEVATAADRITKSHAHFVQDSQDPGSEAIAAEWEMTRILRKLQYFEPHDWTYISRFSATPHEIHKVLKDGLCEDTYLNYQRFICEPAVHEAANDIRSSRYDVHTADDAAAHIDPEMGGGRYPAKLINPS